ncbi:MAG: patatin family protein [Clostridia bacterium]|nr:patatin family protein [Clostridia bacterium]
MKTALILEGGGMRGLYTAGVLDTLMENDISVDAVAGVSAGALFGINYKSKQIGRVLRYNLKYAGISENLGVKSLLKTGDLMSKQFYFDDLPYKLDVMDDETYRNNPTEFYAVVSNLNTGLAEYKSIYDIKNSECMEYLRASGSLPFVSKPVIINNIPYLDGGVCDSIPVQNYIDKGYDKIIVVLTRPSGYRKKGHIHFTKLFYKNYPLFSETLKNRNHYYSSQCDLVDKLETDKRIFVIRPTERIKIKTTEKSRKILQKAYDLGKKDTIDKLNELYDYLEVNNE